MHDITDRGATLLFKFKTRVRCERLNERRLPVVNSGLPRRPSRDSPVPLTRFGATSVSSLFICQTDYEQIKNGEHDARDHDRVKMAALLYGFDQSRRIF